MTSPENVSLFALHHTQIRVALCINYLKNVHYCIDLTWKYTDADLMHIAGAIRQYANNIQCKEVQQ